MFLAVLASFALCALSLGLSAIAAVDVCLWPGFGWELSDGCLTVKSWRKPFCTGVPPHAFWSPGVHIHIFASPRMQVVTLTMFRLPRAQWTRNPAGVAVPLGYPFIAATVGVGAMLFRRRAQSLWPVRRSADGHRCGCGYNLTGNISGVCPECGTPTLGRECRLAPRSRELPGRPV